jgi:GNAT superfamily N-acetyltransferase
MQEIQKMRVDIPQYKLRVLKDQDLEKANEIIIWQSIYLKSKMIDQYRKPYPDMTELRKRQVQTFNYGLYKIKQDRLAVFVSIIPNYVPNGWKEYEPTGRYVWLTSLFTAKEFKGQNVGYIMLQKITDKLILEDFKHILLDCHVGFGDFLVDYYRKDNYKEIARKVMIYPTNTFKVVLMQKDIKKN